MLWNDQTQYIDLPIVSDWVSDSATEPGYCGNYIKTMNIYDEDWNSVMSLDIDIDGT